VLDAQDRPIQSAKLLVISVLSFGRPENILNQLADLPLWLDHFEQRSEVRPHIVIRNNDPQSDFSEVQARVVELQGQLPNLGFTLLDGEPNIGFGEGHNRNAVEVGSDYLLILNDDIGFPHIDWLDKAIAMLATDAKLACIGAEDNPKSISPFFGNGVLPEDFSPINLYYAEASILLFRRSSFDALGGFSPDYAWAMCEDSDLSFRVQQNGWRVGYLDMPHQHWRSTSFNSLPTQVKSSILEHNRAALFANWRDSIQSGRLGRWQVYDLWSDGFGDVFCALPHVMARLARLPAAERANVLINTSQPELFSWLNMNGVRIVSIASLPLLRASLEAEGIASLRTTRSANFSLPLNIHPLLAGTLGIPLADEQDRRRFASAVQAACMPPDSIFSMPRGGYCAIHLEFERDHEGRALTPGATTRLLPVLSRQFRHIVILGREPRLSRDLFGDGPAEITDLQGKLSLQQLAAVVSNAEFFVGIDSFPSHIAQAAFVPAAIFFGSVHPVSRAWNEERVWPLCAPLDCIGCYHLHLEPSVPFCMRRDVACTWSLDPKAVSATLADMIDGRLFSWNALRMKFQALQARLQRVLTFHPLPPERIFRPALLPNEQISNQIYRITEQIGHSLQEVYHTSIVSTLRAQTRTQQAELYALKAALEDVKMKVLKQSRQSPEPSRANSISNRIVQLNTISLAAARCEVTPRESWIEIRSDEEDPQLLLPAVKFTGPRIHLRISWRPQQADGLQIFWAEEGGSFSLERCCTVLADAEETQHATVPIESPTRKILRIRIDPLRGRGQAWLRGSIGGLFTLDDDKLEGAEALPDPKPPKPLDLGAEAQTSRARRRKSTKP
jgi:GT2 family glycosyltransferase